MRKSKPGKIDRVDILRCSENEQQLALRNKAGGNYLLIQKKVSDQVPVGAVVKVELLGAIGCRNQTEAIVTSKRESEEGCQAGSI